MPAAGCTTAGLRVSASTERHHDARDAGGIKPCYLPHDLLDKLIISVLGMAMQFEAVLDLQTDPEGTQPHSASAARVHSQQQPGHQQSVSNQPIQDQVCLLLAALPQHRARVGIEQAA